MIAAIEKITAPKKGFFGATNIKGMMINILLMVIIVGILTKVLP